MSSHLSHVFRNKLCTASEIHLAVIENQHNINQFLIEHTTSKNALHRIQGL